MFREDTANPTNGGSRIWRQPAGHSPAAGENHLLSPLPPPPAGVDYPDFNISTYAALIATTIGWSQPLDIEVDGVSSGNATTPARGGQLGNEYVFFIEPQQGATPAQGAWSAFQASISSTSQGAPNTWVANMAARPQGAGAEVISYYVEESYLPEELVDQTLLETGTSDFLPASYPSYSSASGFLPDIVAMDLFIPEIADNAGLPAGAIMPTTSVVYFSLTTAALQQTRSSETLADALLRALQPKPPILDPIDGGTVFKATWGQGTWENLEVVLQTSKLTYNEQPLTGYNIDALAVGRSTLHTPVGPGTILSNELFAFSLEGSSFPQILMHAPEVATQAGPNPPSMPRTAIPVTPSGDDIVEKMNIRSTDEITALCLPDPEAGAAQPMIGSPIPTTNPAFQHLHLSLYHVPYRGAIANSGRVHLTISGWSNRIVPLFDPYDVFVRYRTINPTSSWVTVWWPIQRTQADDLFSMDLPVTGLAPGDYEVQCLSFNKWEQIDTFSSIFRLQ